MAQVTQAVAQGILDGQGYTDNEVRQLAYRWLAAHSAPTTQAAPAAQGDALDAELGRVAMQFVDRAGDVHPGVDDAEAICAEFHAAMSAVIERMPHVQRMNAANEDARAAARAAKEGA